MRAAEQSLSLHAYKYSHKCKARAPDEPVKEKVNTGKLKEALKEVKPSLTEKQSIKPMKNKVLINNTPEYAPPEPPYHPSQNEIYAHLIQQRQQQAYMRHQAMLAPYANMFASRAH